MIFRELQNIVDKVITNLDEIVVDSMVEEEASIIDINVSQLEEGIGSDGTQVGEYASDEYAAIKQALGSKAPPGVVDTKLSGDFHDGFHVEPFQGSTPGNSGVLIDSRDEKTDKLERKYSDLFGIAPQNIPDLAEDIVENIQKRIRNEITIK